MYSTAGVPLLSAIQVASLRIVIASLVLLPFVLRKIQRPMVRYIVPLFLTGFLGNALPAYFFTFAQTALDSSITGILNSLTPLFTLLVALVLYRKRYPLLNYVGITVALVGAVLLIFEHSSGLSGAPFWAYILVILATVCYALSVNIIRNNLADVDSITVAGLAMMLVSPWCLAILWYDGFFLTLTQNPSAIKGLPYVTVLAVVGSAIALVLFNHLIKITNALFASSVTYLIPVIAIAWGVLDGENITGFDILFTALIISGVYMVNLKRKKHGSKVFE